MLLASYSLLLLSPAPQNDHREESMSKLFSTDFAGRSISLKADYVAGQADGAILAT